MKAIRVHPWKLGIVLLCAATTWAAYQAAQSRPPVTLPIYRLAAPQADTRLLQQLATDILSISKVSPSENKERVILRSGSRVAEMYRSSGGIWLADEAQMWNPELKPALPDESKAHSLADQFFKEYRLLPTQSDRQPITVSFSGLGGTQAAFYDTEKKERWGRKLDTQVNYAVRINLPRRAKGLPEALPVVGGGGEFSVTLGNEGRVIGYNGVWRPIEKIESESPMIPQAEADAQFKQMTRGLKIVSFQSSLAYYSAPALKEQVFLYPVYVYRAVAEFKDGRVPLRLITLPATQFGPKPAKFIPPRKRGPSDRPPRSTGEKDEPPDKSSGLLNLGLGTVHAQNPFEAGTSWIGPSQGLGGSPKNAQGFVDGLAADGWTVNFNWGEANAWESDWRRNDDDWVDAADFVFYTGHASMNGWVLNPPDDTFLNTSEVAGTPGSPSDLWGAQDLEWIIIAACGPLQDNLLAAGGGNVFDRWAGGFDGLHQLLGYGAITFDTEDEGKTVVKYAREGQTIINAWFRAAREIQPGTNGAAAPDGPNIWVGVMYVYKSGATSPANDHLWGHGSVAPDPKSPNIYVAMWTTT